MLSTCQLKLERTWFIFSLLAWVFFGRVCLMNDFHRNLFWWMNERKRIKIATATTSTTQARDNGPDSALSPLTHVLSGQVRQWPRIIEPRPVRLASAMWHCTTHTHPLATTFLTGSLLTNILINYSESWLFSRKQTNCKLANVQVERRPLGPERALCTGIESEFENHFLTAVLPMVLSCTLRQRPHPSIHSFAHSITNL